MSRQIWAGTQTVSGVLRSGSCGDRTEEVSGSQAVYYYIMYGISNEYHKLVGWLVG